MSRPTWDEYFMGMLPQIAARSSDPNTKTSCLIIGPDHEIRSTGYNGFPRGVQHLDERCERPEKYFWVEHAERNAIYNAARVGIPLNDCTLYLNWFPCMDCARAIVQAGIRRIVADKETSLARWDDPKWKADFVRTEAMLAEAGVMVSWWVA